MYHETLLQEVYTIEVIAVGQSAVFEKITELTDLQQKVMDLLKISPFCTHVNA